MIVRDNKGYFYYRGVGGRNSAPPLKKIRQEGEFFSSEVEKYYFEFNQGHT